ncbi:MAG: hypothetical protein WC766_04295 [Patescibacteria group bacterium]
MPRESFAQERRRMCEEFGAPTPGAIAMRAYAGAGSRRRAGNFQRTTVKVDLVVGDVVRDSNFGICVITRRCADRIYLRTCPGGCRRKRALSSLVVYQTVEMGVVFRSPETHAHPYTVYPVRGESEDGEEFYKRAKRLQKFVAANIRAEDRLEHVEYGVFWAKAATAKLTVEFESKDFPV